MARIRSIHPGLASDEAYMQMTFPARAAWPLLWTECDDFGVFEWKPVMLKARIMPGDAIAFEPILAEYLELGVVMRFEVDGKAYGAIRNFCKWQRPKKPAGRFPMPDGVAAFIALEARRADARDDDDEPKTARKRPKAEAEKARLSKINHLSPIQFPTSGELVGNQWGTGSPPVGKSARRWRMEEIKGKRKPQQQHLRLRGLTRCGGG